MSDEPLTRYEIVKATEGQIMTAIGLGNHYQWYNGSGECGSLRRRAARDLPVVLRNLLGVEPDERVMQIVAATADVVDDRSTVLTATWQACADAIQCHLSAVASGFEPGSADWQRVMGDFVAVYGRKVDHAREAQTRWEVDMYGMPGRGVEFPGRKVRREGIVGRPHRGRK